MLLFYCGSSYNQGKCWASNVHRIITVTHIITLNIMINYDNDVNIPIMIKNNYSYDVNIRGDIKNDNIGTIIMILVKLIPIIQKRY